jgi:hypothetical protein
MLKMRFPLAFVVSLFLIGSGQAASKNVQHWFVDSLVKVFPGDLPGGKPLQTAELWAARNGHVSTQLVLRSGQSLSGLTAECSPLKASSGGEIGDVRARAVGYVIVASSTEDTPPEELVGTAPGYYPDVLQNLPVDLKANRTQSIWITVRVPADTAPGRYEGTVKILAAGRLIAAPALRVTVTGATVPKERSLKVTNWLSFDELQLRPFFNADRFTPEWWTFVENVAQVMGEHRQNVIITPLNLLVSGEAAGDGIRYDFSNFDRWVDIFRNKGGFTFIEGSWVLNRENESYTGQLVVPVYLLENGKVRLESLYPDDPRVEPALSSFLTALNRHLEQKDWKSAYLQHLLDEPHGSEPPYYARFAGIVRRCLPGVFTIDAIDIPDSEGIPREIMQNSDIWVPQLGRFDKSVDMLQQRIRSGKEVWIYTCLFPRGRYMNRLMDYPLIKTRLLHWVNFGYNFTGFLHWGGNYWTPEPIKATQPVINQNQTLLPSGDAYIVYPDKEHTSILSSIRLEAMLEGIEDYELLKALSKRNPQQADALAHQAVSTFTDYVRDVATFRKIQRSLLDAAGK